MSIYGKLVRRSYETPKGAGSNEALAWAKRAPNGMPGKKSEMETRPFYEAEDLAEFMTPEELAAPRDGERGKLGVA